MCGLQAGSPGVQDCLVCRWQDRKGVDLHHEALDHGVNAVVGDVVPLRGCTRWHDTTHRVTVTRRHKRVKADNATRPMQKRLQHWLLFAVTGNLAVTHLDPSMCSGQLSGMRLF